MSLLEHNQPNVVERNTRGYEVRSIVYWQGVLKEKRVKPAGHKQRYMCVCIE